MTHYPDDATDYEARYYWKDDILGHLADSEVGGAAAYVESADVPTESDADQVVSSASELVSACESDSQLTVWVDGPIDMGGYTGVETRNITIAGDRGRNGSRGSLVYTTQTERGRDYIFHFEEDVRLTGIRARGPTYDHWENDEYPGLIEYSMDYDDRRELDCQFATLRADDVEVENCEVHGFAVQAFGVGTAGNYVEPEIHHSYIHDNMMTSLGYALTVYRGYPHVHHNFLDAHRHDINGFGYHDAGYLVEDNVFGPSASSHRIDMHSLEDNDSGSSSDPDDPEYYHRGGGNCVIRNNTFTNTNLIHGPELSSADAYERGGWHWIYSNRGIPHPGRSVEIYDNRLMHHGPQSGNPGTDGGVLNFTEDAFVQDVHGHSTNDQGFVRVNHYDNQYDSVHTPYDSEYGAPVNVEGSPPDSAPGRGLEGYRYPRERVREIHTVLERF